MGLAQEGGPWLSGGRAGGEQGAAQLGGWQETKSGGSRGHLAHREAGVSDMLPCSHSLDHPYFLRVCPPAKRLAHPGDRTAGGHDSSGQGRIIIHKRSRSEAPGGRGLGETTLPAPPARSPAADPGPTLHREESVLRPPQPPASPSALGLGWVFPKQTAQMRPEPPQPPPLLPARSLGSTGDKGQLRSPRGAGSGGRAAGPGSRNQSSQLGGLLVPVLRSHGPLAKAEPSHSFILSPALAWTLGIHSE